MMKDGKTKKVANVDLSARCFAYVADESDTSTWHCPLFVPGDAAKTINAIKTSLGRFSETKDIPASERETVWHTLRGAALALGIAVERRTFAPKNEATPPAEQAPTVPVQVKTKDPMIEAVIADADRRATELLRSLGLE